MARRYQLTWCKGERRWRRRYKKKTYNFPLKDGETKETSYRRCLAEFNRVRAKEDLDSYAPHLVAWQFHRERWQELYDNPPEFEPDSVFAKLPGNLGKAAFRSMLADGLRVIEQHIDERRAYPDLEEIFPGVDDGFRPDMTMDEFMAQGGFTQPSHAMPQGDMDTTLEANSGRFLESQKQLVSNSRWDILRIGLEQFACVAGAHTPVDECGSHLVQYLEHVKSRDISEYTKRDRLQVVRQFFRWLYDRNVIEETPRILQSKDWGVRIEPKRIETFSDDEVKALLSNATERTCLFVLLGLNCGYTQQDISDLQQSEVDWDKRTITRKRSKTRGEQNVPTVTYPLWDATYKALQRERSDHPERLLTNTTGEPVVVRKVKDGKLATNDNVRSAFERATRKLEIKKSFKVLRKTAASKLESNQEFARFGELFLGHAPSSVKDRHYAQHDSEHFAKAVAWLGEQFLSTDSPP